jgi:hypothetical protein
MMPLLPRVARVPPAVAGNRRPAHAQAGKSGSRTRRERRSWSDIAGASPAGPRQLPSEPPPLLSRESANSQPDLNQNERVEDFLLRPGMSRSVGQGGGGGGGRFCWGRGARKLGCEVRCEVEAGV